MSDASSWEVALTAEARRSLARLDEKFATAVLEFMAGALAENPHRVGRPLGQELAGRYAARRGVYRVIYVIDVTRHTIVVLRIDHRSDVYRPR